MFSLLSILLTALSSLFRTRAALRLENLALRHQLGVPHRSVKRPKLIAADRLFWVRLCEVWSEWRSALLIVKLETVIAWHGKGLPAAEREFKKALALNPRYANGHRLYASYLAAVSRPEESLRESQLALELDPFSLPIRLEVAYKRYMADDYERARRRRCERWNSNRSSHRPNPSWDRFANSRAAMKRRSPRQKTRGISQTDTRPRWHPWFIFLPAPGGRKKRASFSES